MGASMAGFPEFLPEERIVEQVVLDKLRQVFELHGFASIETRAVEALEELTAKGEVDKEVYVLKRIHADEGDSGMGLHFDLTVPFARYVVENAGKLEFPFRRYQIQKVWRGERPQKGRFREFTQADIDIVDKGELAPHFDAEVAQVMAEALSALPVPSFTLQINNRKILDGFYSGLGIKDSLAVMRIVDKLDKIEPAKVRELLVAEVGDEKSADLIVELAQIVTPDDSFVAKVRELGVSHPVLDEGLAELAAVINALSVPEGVSVHADLRIARGLDYYTGTVFETRLAGYESLGSICSGGRYDELASDGKNTYPGVGISLGVSRLLVPLVADGLVADRKVPSVVLVALDSEESRSVSTKVAGQLRSRGIAAEVAPNADKFGKQIKFAERRGIPFVWFPGTNEVKDIRSGDQVAADPNIWEPPAADLHPNIKENKS